MRSQNLDFRAADASLAAERAVLELVVVVFVVVVVVYGMVEQKWRKASVYVIHAQRSREWR